MSTQRVVYLSDGINKLFWRNLFSPPGVPFCERTQDNTSKAMRKPMVRNKVTALRRASSRGTILFLGLNAQSRILALLI